MPFPSNNGNGCAASDVQPHGEYATPTAPFGSTSHRGDNHNAVLGSTGSNRQCLSLGISFHLMLAITVGKRIDFPIVRLRDA